MPLLEPSLRILTRDESTAVVAMTAEWKNAKENGFYITTGHHDMSAEQTGDPVDTCIANFSLRQETFAWPTTAGVVNHDLIARSPDESLAKLITRKTLPGSDLIVPAHPLMPYADRFSNLVDYLDRRVMQSLIDHRACNRMHHIVFIDAPPSDEMNYFFNTLTCSPTPPSPKVHLVMIVDKAQTYFAKDEDGVWRESGDIVDKVKAALPGFEIVCCHSMRNALAFSTLFGSTKRTHHETTYRADTIAVPSWISFDFKRTACVYTSENLLRSSLTLGSRTLSFQAAPTAPVEIVFFASLNTDSAPDAEYPDLVEWNKKVFMASENSDTTKVCPGGLSLMTLDASQKAIVDKDPLLSAIHALCINNAKDKWSSAVNKWNASPIDALMPPPGKRPCLIPAHSCSVPF